MMCVVCGSVGCVWVCGDGTAAGKEVQQRCEWSVTKHTCGMTIIHIQAHPSNTHFRLSNPNQPTNQHAHTWHHDGWAEGQLLVLVEEVVGVAVKHHAANRLQREHVLGPDLGHVKGVKRKPVLFLFWGVLVVWER